MSRLLALCVALPALAAVVATGCTSALPCTDCPPLAGAWALSWKNGSASDRCPAQGPRPQLMNFTQAGNTVASTLGGVDVKGSVYDTWDFTLKGTSAAVGYALHGRAAPGARPDGGLHMEGTLTTSGGADGGAGCELIEDFSGDQL